MLVPFESLPENGRIWIYQSNRKFSPEEVLQITERLSNFLEGWAAHGTGLQAGFEVRYDRFLIIGIDQEIQAATGCSIDDSVRFIQKLESDFNVDLLDKMNVTFRNGEFIAHKPLADFKKMAKEKAVSSQTIVFNNLVNTVGEYQDFWEVPAAESWHSRFF